MIQLLKKWLWVIRKTMQKNHVGARWVIKIGGSLLGSPELERWLALFAKFSDG